MHNYTKTKGLDSGEITSLPNSENVFNFHEAHLHTMIAVYILTIFPRDALENAPLFATGYTKKKKTKKKTKKENACIFRVSLC